MSEMNEIDPLRKEIDGIDSEVLRLLNRRANMAIRIGKIKADKKVDIHAPHREREVFDRLVKENEGPLPSESIRTIFREVMSASLALEHPLRVAYLGPKATFTHLACLKQFGLSANFIPVHSIKEVFGEVERSRADYGVVPIENSTEGVVNHTLDMFVDSPLKINAEVLQEVSHHLLSMTGRLEDIKRIYSHPHAIAQCSQWLEGHLPGTPVVEVSSTARAAEMCEEDPSSAAIASELASKLYGLTVVQGRIEDYANNFTRFLVIGRGQVKQTGKDKTSIMFSVKDRVGALYQILQPLADLGINLTKIESRPSRKKIWEYLFFVDLEGHVEEDKIQKALGRLEEGCQFLKVLGSYPVAVG